jgi:probable HAF family extracellular repeat protein
MLRKTLALLASAACSASIAAAQSVSPYCPVVPEVSAVQDLGDFAPNAINELGQVVGSHYTGVEWRIVSWTPAGGAVDLGAGYAWDVNNRGAIVFVQDDAAWVRWADGTRQQIASAGSVAYAINDWNEVVGFIGETVFIWRPATGLQLLEFPTNTIDDQPTYDINNAGTVALTSEGSLRLRDRSGAIVIAGIGLQARAVNELDRVAGVMPYFHAATWATSDGLADLGTLGGMNSDAIDVNDVSWIVGRSDAATGDVHAMIVKPGQTMADLGALGGECTGWATGINDAAQVVGSSHDDSGRFRATLWQLKLTPAEALDSLAAAVWKLRNGGLVRAGDARLLLAKIAKAQRKASMDGPVPHGPLTAFAAHVRALERRGRISHPIAQALRDRSDQLLAATR